LHRDTAKEICKLTPSVLDDYDRETNAFHVLSFFKPYYSGTSCGDEAFSRELACPTCDTVLPKDGLVEFELHPDANKLRDIASATYGLTPSDLCNVMRIGLEFWENQCKNEHVQCKKQIQDAFGERDRAIGAVRNASTAFEQEKLRSQGLRGEVESLRSTLTDVERKYAEKSKAARKVTELYEDLRKVYRRLETDLLDASRIGAGHVEAPLLSRRDEEMRDVELDFRARGRKRRCRDSGAEGVDRSDIDSRQVHSQRAIAERPIRRHELDRVPGINKSQTCPEKRRHVFQSRFPTGERSRCHDDEVSVRSKENGICQSADLRSEGLSHNPLPQASIFDLKVRNRRTR
jgi:hypothetical protein